MESSFLQSVAVARALKEFHMMQEREKGQDQPGEEKPRVVNRLGTLLVRLGSRLVAFGYA